MPRRQPHIRWNMGAFAEAGAGELNCVLSLCHCRQESGRLRASIEVMLLLPVPREPVRAGRLALLFEDA